MPAEEKPQQWAVSEAQRATAAKESPPVRFLEWNLEVQLDAGMTNLPNDFVALARVWTMPAKFLQACLDIGPVKCNLTAFSVAPEHEFLAMTTIQDNLQRLLAEYYSREKKWLLNGLLTLEYSGGGANGDEEEEKAERMAKMKKWRKSKLKSGSEDDDGDDDDEDGDDDAAFWSALEEEEKQRPIPDSAAHIPIPPEPIPCSMLVPRADIEALNRAGVGMGVTGLSSRSRSKQVAAVKSLMDRCEAVNVHRAAIRALDNAFGLAGQRKEHADAAVTKHEKEEAKAGGSGDSRGSGSGKDEL